MYFNIFMKSSVENKIWYRKKCGLAQANAALGLLKSELNGASLARKHYSGSFRSIVLFVVVTSSECESKFKDKTLSLHALFC